VHLGELNLEAKGRYISEQAADLVFLQEIDEGCERSGSMPFPTTGPSKAGSTCRVL